MDIHEKVYLGDSVYIHYDYSGLVKLTTYNGVEETNIIWIEPEEVLVNLESYLSVLRIMLEKRKSERENSRS